MAKRMPMVWTMLVRRRSPVPGGRPIWPRSPCMLPRRPFASMSAMQMVPSGSTSCMGAILFHSWPAPGGASHEPGGIRSLSASLRSGGLLLPPGPPFAFPLVARPWRGVPRARGDPQLVPLASLRGAVTPPWTPLLARLPWRPNVPLQVSILGPGAVVVSEPFVRRDPQSTEQVETQEGLPAPEPSPYAEDLPSSPPKPLSWTGLDWLMIIAVTTVGGA